MSASQNRTKLRALLLTFNQLPQISQIPEAADALERSIQYLGGEVIQWILSERDSDEAKENLKSALQVLKGSIESSDEKVVIYYGGHACQMGRPPQLEWRWLAPRETCVDHAVWLDPVPALQDFIDDCENDILFLFHCPINIQRHFRVQAAAPSDRPERNVQLVCFQEDRARIHYCDEVVSRVGGRDIHGMLQLPVLSAQPTFDLAAQFMTYDGENATVFNLLDDMTQSARKERPAPQFRYILGDPDDFVLSVAAPEPDPEAETPEALRIAETKTEDDEDDHRLSASGESTPRPGLISLNSFMSGDADSDAQSMTSSEMHRQTGDRE